MGHTRLPIKDETVKKDLKLLKMCRFEGEIKSSLIGVSNYLAKKETSLLLQGNHEYKRQYKFRTVVCEVSSFAGNPVAWLICLQGST